MKPITRKEYYLAKASGTYTGPTPPPVLREDYYLATLAGDYSGYGPAPVTRLEKYMSAAAGLTTYVPQPVTRIEKYWYAIAKDTGYVPEPVTREEKFLYAILKNPPKPEYLEKTAEGSTILLTDSAQAPLTDLTVYGRSTQDGTPSPENPVPIVSAGDSGEINIQMSDVGINLLFDTGQNKDYYSSQRNWEYSNQNNAIATVIGNQAHYTVPETGTNLNTGFGCNLSMFNAFNGVSFKRGQKYVWSCDAKGVSSPGQSLDIKVFYTNINGSEWVSTGNKPVQLTEDWQRYSCEFTVPNDFDENVNRISLNFSIGTDVTAYLDIKNLKLERGTVATKWTPNPTDGDPLNYQSMTLSTPGGLPGIPVASGGNYTDENGQQWVCDEIDLARGKYVQRVAIEQKTGNFQMSETADVPGRYHQYGVLDTVYKNGRYESFCNIATWTRGGIEKTETEWKFAISDNVFYLNPPVESGITTADELNAVLSSLDFPLVFVGQLETLIETDLPAEEIAAYKALHTYSPTTTVSNDAGAWMKVGYKATT